MLAIRVVSTCRYRGRLLCSSEFISFLAWPAVRILQAFIAYGRRYCRRSKRLWVLHIRTYILQTCFMHRSVSMQFILKCTIGLRLQLKWTNVIKFYWFIFLNFHIANKIIYTIIYFRSIFVYLNYENG